MTLVLRQNLLWSDLGGLTCVVHDDIQSYPKPLWRCGGGHFLFSFERRRLTRQSEPLSSSTDDLAAPPAALSSSLRVLFPLCCLDAMSSHPILCVASSRRKRRKKAERSSPVEEKEPYSCRLATSRLTSTARPFFRERQ
jgi:hypothetical protein